MTILTLDRKELEKKIGKIDEKMQNKISMFGTPIETINENEISVEVFPNRPDLLSFQGFTRAMLAFLGKNTGLKEYKVEKPLRNYKVIIDKSVKKVRPYTVCAIVKGMKFDDQKIKNIIDLQEKLHSGYGRNRKKLAIGIYPLDKIKLPIKFLAKRPENIVFQPLEFTKSISARKILSQHPAGITYGHLLNNCEFFPIFIDSNGEILSMPPIINSEKTGKVTEKTKEIFVECSGFNKEYLKKTLNIIVATLADMGGKIKAMIIEDKGENRKYITPDLNPERLEFSINFLNKNLGTNFKEEEIKKFFSKMGIEYEKKKGKNYALVPAYRTDIIHEIDLAEELAIAYGYENFKPEIPEISTIGEENNINVLKKTVSEILIGLGILEVSSYHLSTKEKQFKKIGIKEFKNKLIELADSKTERDILRVSLIANSIEILSSNSDSSFPQKIFELGKVFYNNKSDIGESEKLCVSICYEKANFTEAKQILDYLMRMFEIGYKIEESENQSFIDGRCGEIIVNDKPVGVIGEINPNVLRNNKIIMPVASFEIDIECFLKNK